ncbi:GAF domain-containing protein [Flavobacterium jejuense]|uniref:GAF domain-containing protein n=1 Tax=Flavobacterium jejuense TaxID=1544455 RepID=A0ABX0ITS6_9FLAO|nr:GAF domain-containing protein [Flavobacterium jejuense]NHN27292.1 GAF domain-containing protein [Flavobacterium jejuense]
MVLEYQYDSPFKILISFHKLIESLEVIAMSDVDYRSNYAKSLLNEVGRKPEFKEGIEQLSVIYENKSLVKNLLADLFPTSLTNNEIKAATIPFQNITFNYSERFKKILTDAGYGLEINISDFDAHKFYVLNCCLILNFYYNQNIEFNNPIFFDIPNSDGIVEHYRILYNADFVEIFPTDKSIQLSQEIIKNLIDNYEDLDLWKKYFPKESWILKGFVIATLVNVTTEHAISKLKTTLIKSDFKKKDLENINAVQTIFRSIFKIADLRIGFTKFNSEEMTFSKPPFSNSNFKSFLLENLEEEDCKDVLCDYSFDLLIKNEKKLIISNVKEYKNDLHFDKLANILLEQDVQSCIMAPIVKEGVLLGVLEVASSTIGALNSINANKLDLVMPFITDTIERSNSDLKNLEEAIIQKEYTAIHSSVYWKFKREAKNYIDSISNTKDYIFKEISFKEVYPMYGQIDIKGSSDKRNETVKKDLVQQIETLISILGMIKTSQNLMILEQRKFELNEYLGELKLPLKADTEQQIQSYIETEIHGILNANKNDLVVEEKIESYLESLDSKTGMFYHHRKDFDYTLAIINKKMASILDAKQLEAQEIYPHYYERFKTDGVEHNLYIGSSISPNVPFDKMYISNLRLWQLQTLCEMELEHHRIKDTLPYALDVTSLILVFSSPISIRFRMDEKRFDVDGSYNARYEVVKKRIDKALILGTNERITEKEKITIVYSHSHEEKEYLKYIKYLQHKSLLEDAIEQFEVEDLQGVSGLKAIRVKVVNTTVVDKKYSYQDLLNELN